MSEHLLFLQAAGTDFKKAHDLVAAVAEIIQASHGESAHGDPSIVTQHHTGKNNGLASRRPAMHPERIADRLEHAGYDGAENLLVALAVLTTATKPFKGVDVDWITAVSARVGDAAVLEAAGVIFAFNTINRIADARRVRLEYRFLRQLTPFQGWVERRLASLTGLAYDLSFKHQSRRTPGELLNRANAVFQRLGVSVAPDIFNWLSRSPVVLEGVLEMIEANMTNASVRSDLLKEAVAIGVVSRAMPGSSLSKAVEQWLPRESLADSKSLRAWAVPKGVACESGLVSACRRYSWQVANAAHTITDEQISELHALGLSDQELLDLTLATSTFSALAIIEPISLAAPPASIAAETTLRSKRIHEVHVQMS